MNASVFQQIKATAKGPCLSVIIPTHETSPQRQLDPIEVKKKLHQVAEQVEQVCDQKTFGDFKAKLNRLHALVDFTHNSKGLGFFVSDQVEELIHFPFDVNENSFLGDTFLLRDLLYRDQLLRNYYLLAVSKKHIRLFKGSGSSLVEIRDQHFPIEVVDDYVYEKPSFGSSFSTSTKTFEKEKSAMEEIRLEHFMKKADLALRHYLDNDTELIITGVKQDLGYFEKITTHKKKLSGKVIGNYETDLNALGKRAFAAVEEFREAKTAETISALDEAFGREQAVFGTTRVWSDAWSGKGLVLFIEKDYQEKAFLDPGDKTRLLKKYGEGSEIILNAPENIVHTVLEKNGKIEVVGNDYLKDHDRVALALRYK